MTTTRNASERLVQGGELEAILDGNSLYVVLDALQAICHEKANHIIENWQDRPTAGHWSRSGNAIERILPTISREGI